MTLAVKLGKQRRLCGVVKLYNVVNVCHVTPLITWQKFNAPLRYSPSNRYRLTRNPSWIASRLGKWDKEGEICESVGHYLGFPPRGADATRIAGTIGAAAPIATTNGGGVTPCYRTAHEETAHAIVYGLTLHLPPRRP